MSSRFVPGLFAAFYTSAAIFYAEGGYLLGTTQKADINVAKKYTYVKHGSTKYMLVDDKGRHFNVDNCFFYWNWTTIDDWANLKLLEQRRIYYYSYRVPFLGMYPKNRIYKVSRETFLSISARPGSSSGLTGRR